MAVRRWAGVLVGAAALATLSACGGAEQPVGAAHPFHRDSADARVYAAYRQSRDHVTTQVRLPTKAEHVRVRIDCTDHGSLRVSLLGGVAELPCGTGSSPAGFIGFDRAPVLTHASTATVRIAASGASSWSVAVDVGSGRLDPAADQ